MNILSNIRIRTKLTILISFVLIGIIAVGGIGFYYNNKANQNLASIYNESLLPIQLLLETRTSNRAIEGDLLGLMLNSNAAEQKAIFDDIEVRKKTITDNLAAYEKISMDSYEAENYNLLKNDMVLFLENLNKTLELIRAGNTIEAYSFYKTTGDKALEKTQTDIRNLSTHNTETAKDIDNQNDRNTQNVKTTLLILIICIAIFTAAFGLAIILSIIRPISKVTKLINKTAELNLVYDTSFEYLMKNKDETGIMAKALGDMRKSLRDLVNKVMTISNNLAASSEELTAATEENTKTIRQVVTTINELAEGNSSQAGMVSNTSNSMSDIVTTIGDVNVVTKESAEHAAYSLEMVVEGQKAVDLTNARMMENVAISEEVAGSVSELGDMITKVGNIVNVITAIAGQTNLLALNAAIEAARAGEAGKGFAVVSEEIRKLAEDSSSAAKEITQIVKDTTEKSKKTTDNMNKAILAVNVQKQALNVTEVAFTKIKAAVEDIANRTQQSAAMLKNVDGTSKEIANQSQDMAAVAEQSAASAEEISASSEEQLASIEMIAQAAVDLSGMAEELNSEITKFQL